MPPVQLSRVSTRKLRLPFPKPLPRAYTFNSALPKVPKRIIVCCDGTWQDGFACQAPHYTNILKIARAIDPQDSRSPREVSIPQVVYYQAGVGTGSLLLMDWFDGAVGGSLRDKVEDAYAFIASNYQPSDEIFLFGFSRGAYTARMVAAIIGEIGILDRRDMDYFADIFDAYQAKAHSKNEEKRNDATNFLSHFTRSQSLGRMRADPDGDRFTIKFIGVFDTVGSLGLPTELRFGRKPKRLFGFPDKLLGPHIQYAYQALAIDETRKDFVAAKFEQTKEGQARGQVLKQAWFTGSHADIGGGYDVHDLSDITLMWMISQVEPFLSVDVNYLLKDLPHPSYEWGKQPIHDSKAGVFTLAAVTTRQFPTLSSPEPPTFEYIHRSVLQRKAFPPAIKRLIENNPNIVCDLQPLEMAAKEYWRKHCNKQAADEDRCLHKNRHPNLPSILVTILLRLGAIFSRSIAKMRQKSD